jgi:choice-of-anchor A domain-containing protein
MLAKSLFRPLLIFAFSVLAVPAMATPLTSLEVLQQFNLVVYHNATSNSHVDGRTYVGGSLSGGDYVQHANTTPNSAYAGLTVGGAASGVNVNGKGIVTGGSLSNANINGGSSVVGGAAANVNFNGGTSYVAGATSGVNFNGGKVTNLSASPALQSMATAATSTNFPQVMNALSDQLSHYASTGSTVSINGNKATFNAVADANGFAVFDLTQIDTLLFGLGEFQFNLGTATTILFNTDNTSYNIGANFLGGSAALLGTKAIWNFYNATSLVINSQFGGVVLATDAALTNNQNIEGTVVVDSLTQHGEIHQQNFQGTLPTQTVAEPGSLLLMLCALLSLCLAKWVRRQG